jgi:hypothetical protein
VRRTLAFARALLRERLVDPATPVERIRGLPIDTASASRLEAWIRRQAGRPTE